MQRPFFDRRTSLVSYLQVTVVARQVSGKSSDPVLLQSPPESGRRCRYPVASRWVVTSQWSSQTRCHSSSSGCSKAAQVKLVMFCSTK